MPTVARADELIRRIRPATTAEAHAWLESAVGGSATASAFAQAARRLGRQPLQAAASETLVGPLDPVPLAGFSAEVAGRAALLMGLGETRPEALNDAVETLYREGDTGEKIAVVRALPLLPDQARWVWLALDAGRTNETELFRAVACDNPFPARHYPELEFNKLVMKAAFVRAPVDRIAGLLRRANPELSRMAMEHIDEQESAGRSFAPELWPAIAAHPPPGAIGRMLGYASHSVTTHRLGAARGLAVAAQPRTRSFLAERLELERDEAVREALLEALRKIDGSQTP
jgi:hypothetical protein